MKRISTLFFLTSLSLHLFAKDDPKYPVSQIPENLKKGMYAVIRESHERFEIVSSSQSKYYVHKVITILNSKARSLAEESIDYDKYTKVNILTAKVYDAEGNLIKKIKNSEIQDRSAFDGFSLFSDNRLKELDLRQAQYPYTIEIEYEQENNFLFYIPSVYLYNDDEVSVQIASYEITYPLSLKPKYKLNKIAEPKKENPSTNLEKLVWRFENIVPEKFEPYMPDNAIPSVRLSPNQFEYGGYSGDMKTWGSLGSWIVSLNNGRDLLPDAAKQKVKELTVHLKSPEQKAKALYEYLQNKTRYVSIQLGIGGYQPFEATTVDKMGYGDCKALSNYMVALLKEAGIESNYALIYSDENRKPTSPDFPINYFNHAVVAMPNGKDTVWLECTSQTAPFGFFGKSTCDRYALMITKAGGVLVKTPAFSADQNKQVTKAEVVVDAQGNAKAKVNARYSGLQYQNGGLSHYLNTSPDDQRKWIEKNIVIPSFEISSFGMTEKKDRNPVADVSLDLILNRYSSVSGKRLFLTPNLMNRSTYVPEKLESRKNKVHRGMAYLDIDSISYSIPEILYPEFMPEPIKINSRYGEYENSVKFDQGKLIYIRKLKMNKGEFPVESYNELIDFYKSINKADNMKLVFLNKT
jgi:transglutaminase-like putative cysteine protease